MRIKAVVGRSLGIHGLTASCPGDRRMDPDRDLAGLDREQLLLELKRLRAGIRAYRDSTGHDLC
jgi:hypothetical protein